MSLPFDAATRFEYAEIGGLVLATPAWECIDLSPLYDAPPVRGDDSVVPYHEGSIPSRRIVAAKRVVLPMVVYGDQDREGNANEDGRIGLRRNLDDLKREVARPAQNGADGTRLLRHVFADGEVRQAPCHVIPPLQVGIESPIAVRCTIDVVVPGGVMRSAEPQEATSPSVLTGTVGTLIVPNGGTADQFETVLRLTGSATDVTIRNLTWDPNGDTWVRFAASVAAGVTVDTAAWTAETDVGADVQGNVSRSGHERWLPLVPGANELAIEPTGGMVTVSVSHYPAWL